MKTLVKPLSVAFVSLLALQGCGAYHFVQLPKETKVSPAYNIELTPIDMSDTEAYAAFKLNVINNTDTETKINWNKTYFYDEDEINGRFMLEGTRFQDRNKPIAPDPIAPHGTYSKVIYPNAFALQFDHGWTHYGFDTGKRGIVLTLIKNGQEFNQTVMLDIKSGNKEE